MAGTDASSSPPVTNKLDPLSPFSLASQEGPGQSISHVTLRSDNYDEWSRSMRRSLKSRRKFGFYDGTIPTPTDEFLLGQWEVVHCTVVQWILNSIDPSIHDSVSDTEDAYQLWSELADQYAVVDGARIHNLKTQLNECRQTKGMSVTTYFGNLKVLWDALNAHEPPFSCNTVGCDCGVTKAALARQDSERHHRFLMGLDKSLYGPIRNHQLSLDPLPSLSRVYHAALQEERLLAGPTEPPEVSEVMAFAVRGSSAADASSGSANYWRALRDAERQERQKLKCSFCSSSGHLVSHCFIKTQKFPEWWGDRPRTLEELKAKRDRAASRSGARVNFLGGSYSIPSSSQDRLSGMSPHWIIDTRASHHVTGDDTWLTDPHTIPPYPVTLPNGHSVSATLAGTVRLNEFLVLHNVLYIPSLTCNLLSVSQLVAATDCVISFTNSSCHIQDRSLRTRIGVSDKFAKRSRKCLFLGYPHNKKGWKVLDLATREIFVSRDVYFYEQSFPYFPDATSPSISSPVTEPMDPVSSPPPDDNTGPMPDELGLVSPPVHGPDSATVATGPVADQGAASASAMGDPPDSGSHSASSDQSGSDLGHGKRTKFLSSRLQGYVVGTTADTSSDSDSSSDSPRSSDTPYALANYLSSQKFSLRHRAFIAAITSGIEPPNFRAALASPDWCKAMQDEITALENNATWEISDLPTGKKALGCRWVEGIDYGEPFAPVIKMVTVRSLLAVAAIKKWQLHQMDVHNGFLHGDLAEEVYMKLPPGFGQDPEGKVCRLKKSLYGLKQAPRCWFAKLAAALRKYGFTQSYSDYSLFSYSRDERKYALDIISETGLLGAKPALTPLEQNHSLGDAKWDFLVDVESYRRLVGRLVYLTVTRPDLSYSVHVLSRFLSKPRKEHLDAALRVVRYLKGSPGQGILLRADSKFEVTG
ncbi:uncharacterized protein LOC141653928 [Silene latifolia]|uniref:uncharacterized protein LOC141653928 n=1 Tax=Silene latifolia TaxID=37657 RepID=UPI003D77E197